MTQGDLFQKEDSLVISGDQGEAEYVPNFFGRFFHASSQNLMVVGLIAAGSLTRLKMD